MFDLFGKSPARVTHKQKMLENKLKEEGAEPFAEEDFGDKKRIVWVVLSQKLRKILSKHTKDQQEPDLVALPKATVLKGDLVESDKGRYVPFTYTSGTDEIHPLPMKNGKQTGVSSAKTWELQAGPSERNGVFQSLFDVMRKKKKKQKPE